MPAIKKIVKKSTVNVQKQTVLDEKITPVDVVEVPETDVPKATVEVPTALFKGFAEVLREQQLLIVKQIVEWANQNGQELDYEKVVRECIPDAPEVAPVKKKSKAAKTKKEKLTDYNKAETQEQLKDFKVAELKEILQSKELPISGSKKVLMARVWGILHPDQAPVEEKKKRGRKKGSTTKKSAAVPTTIDDTPMDEEEGPELDPEKMPTIYALNGSIVDSADGADEFKTFAGKYVFREGEEDFDFIGVLSKNKKTIEFMDEHPEELLKLLGADE